MAEIKDLPYDQVKPGENDRKRFDELDQLAENIAANGLAQPITVRPVDGHYEIVAGERRWRAIGLLDWETIPAIVREMDNKTASMIMLVENTSRQDLRPTEEGKAYQRRVDEFGLTIPELAERLGQSPQVVRDRIKLLSLVPEAQGLVDSGDLQQSFAMYLVPLDNNRQRLVLDWLRRSDKVDFNGFRAYVQKLQAAQFQEELFDLSNFMQEAIEVEVKAQASEYNLWFSVNETLPLMRKRKRLGLMLDQYRLELESAGCQQEAKVVGRVLESLIRMKAIKLREDGKV